MGGKGLRRRLADSTIFGLILWLGTVFVLSCALKQYGFGVGFIVGVMLLAANETLYRVLSGKWSPMFTRCRGWVHTRIRRGR